MGLWVQRGIKLKVQGIRSTDGGWNSEDGETWGVPVLVKAMRKLKLTLLATLHYPLPLHVVSPLTDIFSTTHTTNTKVISLLF